MVEKRHFLLIKILELEKILSESEKTKDIDQLGQMFQALYILLRKNGINIPQDRTHNISQIREITEEALSEQAQS